MKLIRIQPIQVLVIKLRTGAMIIDEENAGVIPVLQDNGGQGFSASITIQNGTVKGTKHGTAGTQWEIWRSL